MRIAKLCVETTRPESALSVLEAGFTKFPESPHLEYWFGRTLEFARDDQRLVDRLLASSVNSIVFRRIGGSRLLSVNRDAEAERFLAPVAGDAGRDDAQVQFCYGLALFRLGRYADADAYLTRAAELEPGVTLHVAYRVRVAVKLGNNDLARKVIDDALQASGEKPDLVALRGELQIESP
jgi:tetratricopeptide (TPR) repeat protein